MFPTQKKDMRKQIESEHCPLFVDYRKPKFARVRNVSREVFYFEGEKYSTLSLAKKARSEKSQTEAQTRQSFFEAFGVQKSKSGVRKDNAALDFIAHHVPLKGISEPKNVFRPKTWWADQVDTFVHMTFSTDEHRTQSTKRALLNALALDLVGHIEREQTVPTMFEIFSTFDAEAFKRKLLADEMVFAEKKKGEINMFTQMLIDKGVDMNTAAPFITLAQGSITPVVEETLVYRFYDSTGNTEDLPRKVMAQERVNLELNKVAQQLDSVLKGFGIESNLLDQADMPKVSWLIRNHTYEELAMAQRMLKDHVSEWHKEVMQRSSSAGYPEKQNRQLFVSLYSGILFAQQLYEKCHLSSDAMSTEDEVITMPLDMVMHLVDYEEIKREALDPIRKGKYPDRSVLREMVYGGEL